MNIPLESSFKVDFIKNKSFFFLWGCGIKRSEAVDFAFEKFLGFAQGSHNFDDFFEFDVKSWKKSAFGEFPY